MGKNIHYCSNCGNYTFSNICKNCNIKCLKTNPVKYSLSDKYKLYRQIYMETKHERY